MELLKDPDSELVAACRDPNSEGFESAFEQLYLRYRDRVYSIAFRITCNAVSPSRRRMSMRLALLPSTIRSAPQESA